MQSVRAVLRPPTHCSAVIKDVTLNVEAERSVSQYTAANSAQRQSM